MGKIKKTVQTIVVSSIRFYQNYISSLMRPCCRFYPSCSQYTLLAIQHYGLLKGMYLGVKRLLRCHPWSEGGYDPIFNNKE